MSNFPWSDYTFTADRFQVIANNEGVNHQAAWQSLADAAAAGRALGGGE